MMKIGVNSAEVMRFTLEQVEFEVAYKTSKWRYKLEEGSEIEILFWSLEI